MTLELYLYLFNRLDTVVCSFLQNVFVWAETVNTHDQLEKLNSSLTRLQSSMDVVQADLTAVKNNINTTLSNPNCFGCNSFKEELQKLTVDTSITVRAHWVPLCSWVYRMRDSTDSSWVYKSIPLMTERQSRMRVDRSEPFTEKSGFRLSISTVAWWDKILSGTGNFIYAIKPHPPQVEAW